MSTNIDLWHCRMGHLHISKLSILHNLVHSITFNKHLHCAVCPTAKQHRLSFPISETRAFKIFDIVHCDIWEPYSVPSIDGSIYFPTIVDDYSRMTWTYLMREKSQTRPIIHSFNHMIQTQFDCKIKVLRSDNGSEFHMNDFFPI